MLKLWWCPITHVVILLPFLGRFLLYPSKKMYNSTVHSRKCLCMSCSFNLLGHRWYKETKNISSSLANVTVIRLQRLVMPRKNTYSSTFSYIPEIHNAWKVSKSGVISGPHFPVFAPEITPYLDTLQTVI